MSGRRFLCVSLPLPGHLDWGGYLATAAELARRGHEVLWVSEARIAAQVEKARVPFQAVAYAGWKWPPDPPPPEPKPAWRYQRAMDFWLTPEWVESAARELIDLAQSWRPDVILGEPFAAAAALAAEAVQVPYIQVGYPATPLQADGASAAELEIAQQGAGRWQALLADLGLAGINWPGGLALWPQSPRGHVCFWSRDWYADEPIILPQTHFVGGVARPPHGPPPAWLAQLEPGRQPLVLVTLGSTFTDDVHFFVGAARAATLARAFVVVAFGASDLAPDLKDKLAAFLPRCIAVRWVDYAHLFPLLSAVVHHGGVGTTHAAAVHGVPQVIVPHGGDQALQAVRADASGVGLAVAPAQANLGRLRQAVETVLRDPAFKIRAGNLAEQLAALGGVDRAADVMAELAAAG